MAPSDDRVYHGYATRCLSRLITFRRRARAPLALSDVLAHCAGCRTRRARSPLTKTRVNFIQQLSDYELPFSQYLVVLRGGGNRIWTRHESRTNNNCYASFSPRRVTNPIRFFAPRTCASSLSCNVFLVA
uniref:Uncharacterized protein n=1 Tax=Sipha flava TaxID=143950 RepID=A0A2S2QQR9_9HEMI